MVKVWKLGLMSYDTAHKIQLAIARKHLDAMVKGIQTNYDTLLLVEHKPVYTVGKSNSCLDHHNFYLQGLLNNEHAILPSLCSIVSYMQ